MILSIDVGTSRVKGALFSPTGRCLGTASASLPAGHGGDPLAHEAEPEAWLGSVRHVAESLLQGRLKPSCVVVSGNGPTLVPVDARGKALHPALTWMDRRAMDEAGEASAVAGSRLDPSFYLPKALWFARRNPAIHERTEFYLGCPEFILRVLTGESLAVFPGEGWEPFYWKAEWLEALGLDRAKFPPLVEPGRIAGTAIGSAARLGIPEGTMVVAGGPDFLAALVGTATTRPGRACDRAGTSEGINLCAGRDIQDKRLLSMPHIIRPLRNISGAVSTSGRALEWWKESSGQGGKDWDSFLGAAAESPPGSGGLLFLPHLAGERAPLWDSQARGAFVGLTLAQGRPEMTRAVVESTALAMRDIIDVMGAAGAAVGELRVTGKPGSSDFWNQVKADVTGLPLVRPRFAEAELLGAACMGFVALGRHGDLAGAAEALVEPGARFEPNPRLKPLYDELFALYREGYSSLKALFPRLGGLKPPGGGLSQGGRP